MTHCNLTPTALSISRVLAAVQYYYLLCFTPAFNNITLYQYRHL